MIPICPKCGNTRALVETDEIPMCPVCAHTRGLSSKGEHAFNGVFSVQNALDAATVMANASPCAKSKRGVCVFHPRWRALGVGHNAPPPGFSCDGSDACREHCNKLCVHAEMDAIRVAKDSKWAPIADELQLVHIKVVASDGAFTRVPSGSPSCWQCSRQILANGIAWVWLLHVTEDNVRYLQAYTAHDFHQKTLEHCSLPVIRDESTI